MNPRTFLTILALSFYGVLPALSKSVDDRTFFNKLHTTRVSIDVIDETIPEVMKRLNADPRVKESFPDGMSLAYVEEVKTRRITLRLTDNSLFETLRMIGELSGLAHDVTKSAVIFRHPILIARIGSRIIPLDDIPEPDATLLKSDSKAFFQKYSLNWEEHTSEAFYNKNANILIIKAPDFELDLLESILELRRRGMTIAPPKPNPEGV